MNSSDGIVQKMVEEAMERVAQKGWERATQKELTLACFGMMSRMVKHEMSSFRRPFLWLASISGAGVFTYAIVNILGG